MPENKEIGAADRAALSDILEKANTPGARLTETAPSRQDSGKIPDDEPPASRPSIEPDPHSIPFPNGLGFPADDPTATGTPVFIRPDGTQVDVNGLEIVQFPVVQRMGIADMAQWLATNGIVMVPPGMTPTATVGVPPPPKTLGAAVMPKTDPEPAEIEPLPSTSKSATDLEEEARRAREQAET